MKFPSLFKTATPQRFEIKPRYYDPIKEELEQRTARIKKELEDEGLISAENRDNSTEFGNSIRGSFSSHRGIKQRDTSIFNSTAMIRTLLFFVMVSAVFGYIYVGPVIFTYLAYLVLAIAGLYLFFKLNKRGKNE